MTINPVKPGGDAARRSTRSREVVDLAAAGRRAGAISTRQKRSFAASLKRIKSTLQPRP